MKKNNQQSQQQLSPEQYIRTRARKLPINTCYINKDWEESGMANIVVSRKHSNGNYTFGFYLVDLFALGTKDTFYNFNIEEDVINNLLERINDLEIITVDYTLVHNIIYGANAFAEDHGFKIYSDFNLTQYILEEDDDNIELIEIEFGKNGAPLIIG
jgi:hypothetical protein